MNITQHLNSKGFHTFEGYSQQVTEQIKDLKRLTGLPNLKVMEIGFNAGHSAEVFLQSNTNLTLVSFDLGSHDYVRTAKEYIDATYPGRHTLILGDSTKTVPAYVKANPGQRFDVIFIDGGHDYAIAKSDMDTCYHLAHKDTIVIMDDTIFRKEWVHLHTIGPTAVWNEYLAQNKLHELGRKEYCSGRGMCWGKYILPSI